MIRKMNGRGKAVFSVLTIIIISFCAKAELITIGFSGLVDSVGDEYNLLEGAVQSGNSISGFYIYDSDTPDSESDNVNFGFYEHWTSPYGMTIMIGDLTFQTDSTNVDFAIGLRDNYNSSADFYTVTSLNNLELDDGLSIDTLHWQLDDHLGTALSSDILPLTPPDLSKWQTNALSIMGGSYPFPSPGEKTLFDIDGHVTDVWLVPELATLLLLGLGGLLLRKRR
jgi:hypothetical protein